MINRKQFKEFLMLFQYGLEDTDKKYCIDYILNIMEKADKDKINYTFDELADEKYLPNLCVGHDGKLFIDSRKMLEMFYDYLSKTKYVKTEVANIVRESFAIMHDNAVKQLEDTEKQ